MSDIRAPVACEKCGGQKTEVLQLTVEHQQDGTGNLIPKSLTYFIRCPNCGHSFKCELPPDAPP